MSYVNGGIVAATTKKALIESVKDNPESLFFYATSQLGPQFTGPVSTLPKDGKILTVAGPNPYDAPKWWANITWKNGKLVVTKP